MGDNFDALLKKLDEFTRKYYKNQLLRGSLIFLSVVLVAFLACLFTDFFAHFSTGGRTFLFFSLVGLTGFTFYWWIARPVSGIYRWGKIISHEQAAQIIGHHFSNVNDKIVNTLQLRQAFSAPQQELILASIDQKVRELRPVPFTAAIDLKQNRRYLKYALPPLLILVLLLAINPRLVSEGTDRLVNYNEEYIPVAPFRFEVTNTSLVVAEKSDIVLKVKVTGEALPNEVYIRMGDITRKLDKTSRADFSFNIKNIQHNTPFVLSANGFDSKEYEIKVLPRPTLLDFQIKLEYPKYLGKEDQTVSKTGDLSIPEGTRITWTINTRNTEELKFLLFDSAYTLKPLAGGVLQYKHRAKTSGRYGFMAFNSQVKAKDSLGYFLNVIPDQYPTINVEETIDTLTPRRRYFTGAVSDDYGLTNLVFYYRHIPDSLKESGKEFELKSMPVSFARAGTGSKFIHYLDMEGIDLQPGDQVEYFFTVWDNDGVNGPKSARSQMKVFRVPTKDEINKQTEKNNSEIKNQMEAALKDVKKLQKEFDNFQRDLLEKKNFDWQQKQKAEDLLKKQNDLQLRLQQLQNINKQNNEQKTEFTQPDPQLLEKQQMLQELFDKLMTDDMKKLMEEIQKMMENMDKNAVQQQMEKMQLDNKDMEKELDRSLELFKQLEFEEKMNNVIDKLEELSEKQDQLSEESKEKNADSDKLEKEQKELNKEFDEVKKEMDDINKLNEELDREHDLESTQEDQKNIDQQMKESSENLQNNKNKKASENQKNAAEKMQEMSNKLQKMMQSAQEKENEMDMQALRQLLENILHLSFDQEDLMNQFASTGTKDPKYVKLGQSQRKLKDDARMVEDSLFALSKRVAQLKSYVNQEIDKVNENMNLALKRIEDRNTSLANRHQQYVMTSLNNLALLLDDALQQLQQQQQQSQAQKGNPKSKGKKGNCKKPGNAPGDGSKPGDSDKPSFGKGNKPSVKSLKQMQEQMSKQLEQLKKQMQENGKNPGNKGNNGNNGNGGLMPGMSEDIAKAAAKQQAIRQALQQMGQELNKDGSGNGKELQKIAEEMEKNEEDLVNKNINIETLRRQQDILTRLLESEKAERERDQDNKRESHENKIEDFGNQKQFLEYKRKKEKEVELLKTVPPALTPYYKQKVNQYFNKVQ
jgi:hypothetical protein